MGDGDLKISSTKAWVVAVSMGYGHQRTAYPLKDISPNNNFINANDYIGMPEKDRRLWENLRQFYESISNFEHIPLVGDLFFSIFDYFQKIADFYPRRDLSKPNFVLKQLFKMIKNGWGKHLIEKLSKNHLPLVSTFFVPVFMAEVFNYPGDIYCIICDADIARGWAPENPQQTRIHYFASTHRVAERLKSYGVPLNNIILTGYPLPKENIGINDEIVKHDFSHRILNLDPSHYFRSKYEPLLKSKIGPLPYQSNHILTIMFSVGGAGAQKEIGAQILASLKEKILSGKIRLFLASGIKDNVSSYFQTQIAKNKLSNLLNSQIKIIKGRDLNHYFENFNLALRETDILWTKPSELSFYSGLGIPIIIAPPLGSQEKFNQQWLLTIGAGINQQNPIYADEWIFDLLNRGIIANSAFKGFIEVERRGAFKIEEYLRKNEK